MLQEIDRVCRKNDIKYSLTGGSVIGYHLYGGFIPWDDDIDLMMTRDNYERFLEVWQREPNQRYALHNFENKKNKVTLPLAKDVLVAILPTLNDCTVWNNDALYEALLAVSEKLGCKSGAVMWCARIAVSGMAVTPGGATEIMAAVGKEESLRRLQIALDKL